MTTAWRTDAEPERVAAGTGRLYVEFAGWRGWLEADSLEARARLLQMVRPYCTPPHPEARSGISVSLERAEVPVIRLVCQDRPCDLDEILAAPEWKNVERLPDSRRRLYADRLLGPAPALEAVGDEIRVLRPDGWPTYTVLWLMWLVTRERPVACLHAAVSSVEEQSLVLVGRSGAGKSTLSWALHTQGAVYHGDEWAFFTFPDSRLQVFQTPHLRLRPGGVEVLTHRPDNGRWYEMKPGDRKCAVPLEAPVEPCPAERVAFYFLDGFAEKPERQPMRPGEAVPRLLRGLSCGNPSIPARLEMAVTLAERHPCWRLVSGRPEETAALLIQHAREGR